MSRVQLTSFMSFCFPDDRQHPLEPATVAPIAAPSTDGDEGDSVASDRAVSDGFQILDDHTFFAEPPGDAEWVEVVPEPEFEARY